MSIAIYWDLFWYPLFVETSTLPPAIHPEERGRASLSLAQVSLAVVSG